MKTILKLRIDRYFVASTFPFDLIYLVPRDRLDVLERLFPWSLGITINSYIQDRLNRLPISNYELYSHQNRARIHPDCAQVKQRLQYATDTDLLLVPILPLRRAISSREAAVSRPSYLGSAAHQNKKENVNWAEQYLDDDTILFTPRGAIRPVCIECPRNLFHLQGECNLGGEFCFDNLIFQGGQHEQLQKDGSDRDSVDTEASS